MFFYSCREKSMISFNSVPRMNEHFVSREKKIFEKAAPTLQYLQQSLSSMICNQTIESALVFPSATKNQNHPGQFLIIEDDTQLHNNNTTICY